MVRNKFDDGGYIFEYLLQNVTVRVGPSVIRQSACFSASGKIIYDCEAGSEIDLTVKKPFFNFGRKINMNFKYQKQR